MELAADLEEQDRHGNVVTAAPRSASRRCCRMAGQVGEERSRMRLSALGSDGSDSAASSTASGSAAADPAIDAPISGRTRMMDTCRPSRPGLSEAH